MSDRRLKVKSGGIDLASKALTTARERYEASLSNVVGSAEQVCEVEVEARPVEVLKDNRHPSADPQREQVSVFCTSAVEVQLEASPIDFGQKGVEKEQRLIVKVELDIGPVSKCSHTLSVSPIDALPSVRRTA